MRWIKSIFRGRADAASPASKRVRLGMETLEARDVPTVTFHGGNVLPHVEAQALYLGSQWSSVSSNTTLTATVDSFLKDVTGGAYMTTLNSAGYGVNTGTAS